MKNRRLSIPSLQEGRRAALDVLLCTGGWITPGTGRQHQRAQLNDHLSFLARPLTPATRCFLFSHCGWWLDSGASPAVKTLTGLNPEPNRNLLPSTRATLRRYRRHIQAGRLEYTGYPYAACVAEATTGEGLLRGHRMTLDNAERAFGARPRLIANHDAGYALDWGTVQMPQIARLLGIDLIYATGDGLVTAPDGTTVRFIGHSRSHVEMLQSAVEENRPRIWAFELHDYLNFVKDLASGTDPALSAVRFDIRAVTLDDYLHRVRLAARCDARRMGTKNWYGGTIDSLLQEQNAKSVELRLPAVEALAVLTGQDRPAVLAALADLWKQSFILMDNHTLWQCHNYKAHYLPRSFELVEETQRIEAALLGRPSPGARNGTEQSLARTSGGARNNTELLLARTSGGARNRVLFNPVPWARDLVVEDGPRTLAARAVPGWGRVVISGEAAALRRDRDARTLSNDRIRCRLNAMGEVVEVRTPHGTRRFQGLGRLMRIRESGQPSSRRLRAGETLNGFEGSASATAEIPISDRRTHTVSFAMDGLEGEAFLLQSERLREDGRVIGTQWLPLHSLHWGKAGMPRRRNCIGPKTLQAWGAYRLRVTLWLLSQGRLRLGRARAWTHSDNDAALGIADWRLTLHYRNAYETPAKARSRVVRSDAAMKTIRFEGRLPDLRYTLEVSLRAGSEAIEYNLRLLFPRPTRLGLRTPPFSEEDGSLLGAQCERPYVPGLAVLLPLPSKARYYSDKPFYLQRAFQPSDRTWHTDRQDWWLGMSTFIGMNLAVAEEAEGQIGLLTRGIKHFFRWKRGQGELLGLSLGASIIHQQTQGHSVPPESPLYEVAKRTTHDPYFATPFLRAEGEYRFDYALAFAAPGAPGRLGLWKQAQEFALPARAAPTREQAGLATAGVACEPASVVITALEPRGGRLHLRVLNMSSAAAEGRIRLGLPLRLASSFPGRKSCAMNGGTLAVRLPPWALREIVLEADGHP